MSEPRPVGRRRATTAAGRAAPPIGSTPERQAKGAMLPPLDALRNAGLIDAAQHHAGLEYARLRRLIFGDGRPAGAHRTPGRAVTEAELAAIERRLAAGRVAIGGRHNVRLIERIALDHQPITAPSLPDLRRALGRLAAAWASMGPVRG